MSKRLTANLICHKIRLLNNRIDLQIVGGHTDGPAFRKNMVEHKTYFDQLKKISWQPKGN